MSTNDKIFENVSVKNQSTPSTSMVLSPHTSANSAHHSSRYQPFIVGNGIHPNTKTDSCSLPMHIWSH